MTTAPHATPSLPEPDATWHEDLHTLYRTYGHELFACLGYAGTERSVVLAALTQRPISAAQQHDLQRRVAQLHAQPVQPTTLEGRTAQTIRRCLPALLTRLDLHLATHTTIMYDRPCSRERQLAFLAAALNYPVERIPHVVQLLKHAAVPTLSGRGGCARLGSDYDLLTLAEGLVALHDLTPWPHQVTTAIVHYQGTCLMRHGSRGA